jgi:hypothetical protein
MLLWQLKLQKPFAWDQQVILQKFAVTAGMRHRRLLQANMPLMHATPTLTWCCCGKARATKEW